MKCCVCARAFYESPYLDFFIEHYLKLGFNKIIIIKADKFHYTVPEEFRSNVDIHIAKKNLGNGLIVKLTKFVKKSKCDWVLSVDIDELLVLNKKYNTIQDYVKEKINYCNDINTIYFRWCILEKYDNNPPFDFNSVFNKYKLYSHTLIKSMVKISSLKCLWRPHKCQTYENHKIYFEQTIFNKNQVKHSRKDVQTMYDECLLVHVHTRSIHNFITKSLVTSINKHIKDIDKFKIFIDNDLDNNKQNNGELLNFLKCIIGKKASLPFDHGKPGKHIIIYFNNYNFFNYKYNIIDTQREKDLLEKALKNNKINIEKYYQLIERINNYIYKKKLFIC
jgi:hypothetical protein